MTIGAVVKKEKKTDIAVDALAKDKSEVSM